MQGVHHDKPKENPLDIKAVCLAVELYRLDRHAHRQVGGGDLGLRIHAGRDYFDHHRGRSNRGRTFISHRYTLDRQGIMVIGKERRCKQH